MKEFDISCELSRTYRVVFPVLGSIYERTIHNPVSLFIPEKKHSFHRIWDGSTMCLMPAPGPIECDGRTGFVEVSWIPMNPEKPCKF